MWGRREGGSRERRKGRGEGEGGEKESKKTVREAGKREEREGGEGKRDRQTDTEIEQLRGGPQGGMLLIEFHQHLFSHWRK